MINSEKTITIGLPVYNGGKTIQNALDTLLSQSYKNFELIISDNASTDETESICLEFAKKDKRIKYYRQPKKINVLENFNLVLEKSNSEFFMWAGSDDIWHPEFIKKNLHTLQINENAIGSTSEIEFFYKDWSKDDFKRFKNTSILKKYQLVHPITGTYENKVNFLFTFNHSQCIYGLFKTDVLKKSIVKKNIGSVDYAILLNILKYGDILVVDELLKYQSRSHKEKGIEKLLFSSRRKQNYGLISCLFPFASLTLWCAKNLGVKIFLKNINRFVKMNYRAERLIFLEIFSKNN